jgi:hypothetical protein
LSFNTATGAITGSATVVISETTYTVTVTDQVPQQAFDTFKLIVDLPPAVITVLEIASKDLVFRITTPAFTPVTASGGTGTLVFSISAALPSGLIFNTVTGAISGTPTVVASSSPYTIRVTGSLGQYSEKTFSLSVAYPILSSIIVNGVRSFVQNSAITEYIPVAGTGGYGTLTYSVSPSLPSGLSFNSTDGKVTGTSTVVSSDTTYTVTITDAVSQTTQKNFKLEVTAEIVPPIVTTLAVPSRTIVQKELITAFAPVTVTTLSSVFLSSPIALYCTFALDFSRASITRKRVVSLFESCRLPHFQTFLKLFRLGSWPLAGIFLSLLCY